MTRNKHDISINSVIANDHKSGDHIVKFRQQTIDHKIAAGEVIPRLGMVSKNTVTVNITSDSTDMTVSKQRHTKGSTIPLQDVLQKVVSSENNVGKQQAQTCIGTDNETMKQGHVKMSEDYQNEYPFTYLAKAMSQPSQDRPVYHTVKAFISTLTSKLTSVNDKWSLSCKINDGTMAIEADLSNQVLTDLIGFSFTDSQEMKKRLKKDPKVKELLLEGIQHCQQKLIELVCLLELEISASNPRPLIVATKQLTSHHMDLLYNRVMANWDKL